MLFSSVRGSDIKLLELTSQVALLKKLSYGMKVKIDLKETSVSGNASLRSSSLALYGCLMFYSDVHSNIQLFRERLSYRSVKVYAQMPKGIMGSGSSSLLDRSSRAVNGVSA